MKFQKPIPFKEALESQEVKRILPTIDSSRDLARLAPEIRERARFSARTAHVGYLSKLDRMIKNIVSPSSGDELYPTEAASARSSLKQELAKLGYSPDPKHAGTLRDLSSDVRLNLIIKMNTQMAYGYGQFVKGNDPVILDAYPCQELFRLESREEPRDWMTRWYNAGGKLYQGRMIAKKDDGILTRISAFGTPYPPFDYNSGMWTRDVHRKEAERLGVIKKSTVVKPQKRNLNEDIEYEPPSNISPSLLAAIKMVFSDYIKGG